MSKWLNTKHLVKDTSFVVKPCHKLRFCPYGQLVEEFPLEERNERSCKVFGHECPVFYHAEAFAEELELLEEESE